MTEKSGNRPILVDASSAIILAKVRLSYILADIYHVVLARAVFDEITAHALPGASDYLKLAAAKKITVIDSIQQDSRRRRKLNDLKNPGKGELDTLQLYYEGLGDFVMVDDGDAAKYCRRKQIPFINALLFPVILEAAGIKTIAFRELFIKKITATGRYSDKILTFARTCPAKKNSFFLP